jgi:hypothetical protein
VNNIARQVRREADAACRSGLMHMRPTCRDVTKRAPHPLYDSTYELQASCKFFELQVFASDKLLRATGF